MLGRRNYSFTIYPNFQACGVRRTAEDELLEGASWGLPWCLTTVTLVLSRWVQFVLDKDGQSLNYPWIVARPPEKCTFWDLLSAGANIWDMK